MVAWSSELSGVEASGVSVTVSVIDWPRAKVVGVKPVRVRPLVVVPDSATLVSATLPALVIVIVSVTATPGIVFTAVGVAVTVTASMTGTVNVTV